MDRVCEELFLSPRARERDDNLLFVRERLLHSDDVAGVLDLCLKIQSRTRAPDDETNHLIATLRLSGITRAVAGQLRVRNQIYEHVFDRRWTLNNMPDAEVRRQRAAYRKGVMTTMAIAGIIIMVAGLGLVACNALLQARVQAFSAMRNQAYLLAERRDFEQAVVLLDRLQVEDSVRFEQEQLEMLREICLRAARNERSEQENARAEVMAVLERDIAAGAEDAGDLAVAGRLVAEDVDSAVRMLERLKESKRLDAYQQADVCGYLGIAYFIRAQAQRNAEEKRKGEGQAILMFRQARMRNPRWWPPVEWGAPVLTFFKEKVR